MSGVIGTFTGKFARLTAMSPRELAHRVREKSYSQLERIGLDRPAPSAPDGSGFKAYLASAPARRFYFGAQAPQPGFVQRNFPDWIARVVKSGDRLLRHHFELLSLPPIQLGRHIEWHRDPLTGRAWELRFWTDYRPENGPAGRDSKIIHELNRHQHLPRLAKAYAWTGDERYAAEAVAQLESWIEQNPPGWGINWQSSLEIGIRSISWLWTMFLLLPSRAFTDAAAERIGDSLFAQLEHVHRHPSVFSSPNTHLIGEAAALFIAGTVFRDREHCAGWMQQGAALLIQTADQQILDDGVHGELSACYHCYALDFYLQALTLAAHNDFEFPKHVHEKARGMLDFVMHLTTPGGTIPLLGDDDGGRALALEQSNYRSFNDALALGAILFQRSDFKHRSGGFCEENFWLLGNAAWDAYDLLQSAPPIAKHAIFPSAGYAMQRSGWGPRDSQLIFDCGGLGMLTGGHSHADALSVTLFGGGKQLLADPGTFVYNGAPEWRGYFRSTRAHNTVAVDGRGQAETGGTFRWKSRMSTRTQRDASLPGEYLEAEHDGYAGIDVIHRRRLLNIPGDYWIVADDFRGSGIHTFDFFYHFGAGLNVALAQPNETGLTIRDQQAALSLAMYTAGPLAARLLRAETNPPAGWESSGYGHKQPISTLQATLRSTPPAAALTILSTHVDPLVIRQLRVDQGNAIACSVERDGFRDLAIYSIGASEIALEDFRMRGEFFWLRLRGTKVLQATVIRGSLQRNGRNVLEELACAQSAAS